MRARPGRRSPARVSWAQSENRHWANSSVMSSNASSMPSSATQSWSSRIPGRVDDERTRRELDQLAAGGRVAALAVLADLLRREQLLARERVDERRLADARRAEQHGGRARLEERASPRRGPSPVRLEIACTGTPPAIVSTSATAASGAGWRSAFVSTITGPRAALPREDQVALEPAQAQVLVHRGDEERDVDVRGEHLLLGRLPGGLARELREPRQDGRDRAHGEPASAPGATTTQSPTTGRSAFVAASWTRRRGTSQRSSPSSVSTS